MLVKNSFYQWVTYRKFLRFTGMFRRSVLSNWSCYLCDYYQELYYKLKIYLWTFQQRQEYNEQLKKQLL